jgi:chromosome segregation ATPase
LTQIEKVVEDNRNNMTANNQEVMKTQNKLTVVEQALRDLKQEYNGVYRLREAQDVSIKGIQTDITKLNQKLLLTNERLTPNDMHKSLEQKINFNFEKVSYALTDLKNLIMTTDCYIDKFLPFRMNKEMANFLQFVLEED